MEGEESLLDTHFDEEILEDACDVEMLDVEEGELVEQISRATVGGSSVGGGNQGNQESESNRPNSRNKKKRNRNKRKRGSNAGPNVTNINRFVLDACKRLRERKSYLMYTAVGCLGVAALSDLIKEEFVSKLSESPNWAKVTEVDAIQSCGGQKTADGCRFRSGGGILWNIIKIRDPNAYKEIMKKGKEFEKQFKQQLHDKQEPNQTEAASKSIHLDTNQVNGNPSDGLEIMPHDKSQHEPLTAGQKRASVHDRIRTPVTYDDLLGGEDAKNKLVCLK